MTEPLIIIPGDVDQNRGYRITKWKKFDNYECIHCQYSTLWIEKMEKHQAKDNHPWAYPVEDRDQLSKAEEIELDY